MSTQPSTSSTTFSVLPQISLTAQDPAEHIPATSRAQIRPNLERHISTIPDTEDAGAAYNSGDEDEDGNATPTITSERLVNKQADELVAAAMHPGGQSASSTSKAGEYERVDLTGTKTPAVRAQQQVSKRPAVVRHISQIPTEDYDSDVEAEDGIVRGKGRATVK